MTSQNSKQNIDRQRWVRTAREMKTISRIRINVQKNLKYSKSFRSNFLSSLFFVHHFWKNFRTKWRYAWKFRKQNLSQNPTFSQHQIQFGWFLRGQFPLLNHELNYHRKFENLNQVEGAFKAKWNEDHSAFCVFVWELFGLLIIEDAAIQICHYQRVLKETNDKPTFIWQSFEIQYTYLLLVGYNKLTWRSINGVLNLKL